MKPTSQDIYTKLCAIEEQVKWLEKIQGLSKLEIDIMRTLYNHTKTCTNFKGFTVTQKETKIHDTTYISTIVECSCKNPEATIDLPIDLPGYICNYASVEKCINEINNECAKKRKKLDNKYKCPECDGSGKLYHGPDDDCYTPCKKCDGSGIKRTCSCPKPERSNNSRFGDPICLKCGKYI